MHMDWLRSSYTSMMTTSVKNIKSGPKGMNLLKSKEKAKAKGNPKGLSSISMQCTYPSKELICYRCCKRKHAKGHRYPAADPRCCYFQKKGSWENIFQEKEKIIHSLETSNLSGSKSQDDHDEDVSPKYLLLLELIDLKMKCNGELPRKVSSLI